MADNLFFRVMEGGSRDMFFNRLENFLVMILIFFANHAYANEVAEVSYNSFLYEVDLPKPFHSVMVGAKLSSENLELLDEFYIVRDRAKIIIGKEYFSNYRKVNLNSGRIYWEPLKTEPAKDNSFSNKEEYLIDQFSICLEYGDLVEGSRLNRKGWYRNVLQVVVADDNSFNIISLPVAEQNVPDGLCVK